jgi:hypothetical protein
MNAWIRPLACLLVLGLAVACSSGDDDDTSGDDDSTSGITVSGNAFSFPDGNRLVGGTVTIVEMPDLSTTTGDEGYFEFTGLPVDEEATFVITAEGFPIVQTGTFVLADDIERVTFQVPDQATYDAFALLLGIEIDPAACQMVTTVTRVGKSLYDEGAHGEEGATVTADPAIDAAHGPVYFASNVVPDLQLTETSDDGGVVWTNVPVGEYDLFAEKEGVEFDSPHMKCRAGMLVNASPPNGLQALQ